VFFHSLLVQLPPFGRFFAEILRDLRRLLRSLGEPRFGELRFMIDALAELFSGVGQLVLEFVLERE
jgi:hypothetical protein